MTKQLSIWAQCALGLVLSGSAFANSPFTIPHSFSVGPTGQSSYSVPIEVPPGIAGMQPELSIDYSSMASNGPLGVGWAISGFSSISRCNEVLEPNGHIEGVRHTPDDALCMDGQRLIKIGTGTYRKEIDDFSKIEVVTSNSYGATSMKVQTKAGLTMYYGKWNDAQILRVGTSSVVEMKLSLVTDRYDNAIEYFYYYDQSTGEAFPSAITYTKNDTQSLPASRAVRFVYGDASARPDKQVGYYVGAKRALLRRLERIETYIEVTNPSGLGVVNPLISGTLVKSYPLTYSTGNATSRTRLETIGSCGHKAGTKICHDPIRFEYLGRDSAMPYTAPGIVDSNLPAGNIDWYGPAVGDFNGDGIADSAVLHPDGVHVSGFLPDGGNYHFFAPVPNGDGTRGHFADFNADGFTDLLMVNQDGHNTISFARGGIHEVYFGSTDANPREVDPLPRGEVEWENYDLYFGDFNGDGFTDVLSHPKGCGSGCATKVMLRKRTGDGFHLPIATDIGTTNRGLEDSAAPKLVLGDFDGDGRVDVLYPDAPIPTARNETDSEGNVTTIYPMWPRAKIHYSEFGDGSGGFTVGADSFPYRPPSHRGRDVNDGLTVGDFNGDGLADVFVSFSNGDTPSPGIYLARGDRKFAPQTQLNPVGSLETWNYSVTATDMNGDSFADLVYWSSYENTGVNSAALSNGCSGVSNNGTDAVSCTFTPIGANLRSDFHVYKSELSFGDFNGDGLTDMFVDQLDSEHHQYLYLNQHSDFSLVGRPQALPDMLVYARAGSNAANEQIYFDYKPLTSDVYEIRSYFGPDIAKADELRFRGSMYVVSRVQVSNGFGGWLTSEYTYLDARTHRRGRGFLGFTEIVQKDVDRDVYTSTTYQTNFPLTGMVDSTWRKQGNGSILSRITNTVDKRQTAMGGWFPFVRTSIEDGWDLDGSVRPEVTTTNEYDAYGNLTRTEVETKHGGSVYANSVTVNQYVNNTSQWILGRLWCSDVTETIDGQTYPRRSAAFEYFLGSGQLATEIQNPAGMSIEGGGVCGTGGSDARLITRYTYDAFGEESTKTVERGDTDGDGQPDNMVTTRVMARDQRNKELPVVTVTTKGPYSDFVTTQTFDARTGALVEEFGPDGPDLKTEWIYDPLGRLTRKTGYVPAGTGSALVEDIVYAYGSGNTQCGSPTQYVGQHAYSEIRTARNDGTVTTGCFDGLGRNVLTRETGPSGAIPALIVGTLTEYDYLGRVARTSRNLSGDWTTYPTYDKLDRAVVVVSPDGSKTMFNYSALSTGTTFQPGPSNDNEYEPDTYSVVEANPLGQTWKVTDAAGVTTEYTYRDRGSLTRIQPPGGNTTAIVSSYDDWGRKEYTIDPDRGVQAFWYYRDGSLKEMRDANGKSSRYYYDNLGRMNRRVDDADGASPTTTFFQYDTAPRDASRLWKNRLHMVVRENSAVSETHSYDSAGRPSQVTYGYANGESYSVNTSYDNLHRPETTTYPESGLRLKRVYNGSRLYELRDTTVVNGQARNDLLWREVGARTPDGQITRTALGNGLQTDYSYNPSTSLLDGIGTGRPTGDNDIDRSIQHLSYVFTSRGNLKYRQDNLQQGANGSVLKEEFRYDGLGRITQSILNGKNTAYGYDLAGLGNLTYRSDLGTLVYDGRNGAGPHAVTNVALAISPTPNQPGDIDGNGYVTDADYNALVQLLLDGATPPNAAADCRVDGRLDAGDLICVTRAVALLPPGVARNARYASEFAYDSAGNMTSGAGRTVTYTSFNKPKSITQSDGGVQTTIDFEYDTAQARMRKTTTVQPQSGGTSQVYVTTYVGGLFDKTVKPDGTVERNYYIAAPTGLVAIKTQVNNDLAGATTRYTHLDHLGSVVLMTDSAGNVVPGTAASFGPFGNTRAAAGWDDSVDTPFTTPEQRRGFTGHEQLDSIGLVHMNGRIYDPVLGRFMTPDPVTEDIYNLQTLNRYSYVRNNPLSLTDPTGYKSKGFGKFMRQAIPMLLQIGISVVAPYLAPVVAAGVSGFAAYAFSGGDGRAALAAALTAGFAGVGNGPLQHALVQGAVGGVASRLTGESYGRGIASGIFSSVVGREVGDLDSYFGEALVGAVIGGTAAAIGGGKFANGAITGAFKGMLGRLARFPAAASGARSKPVLLASSDTTGLAIGPQPPGPLEKKWEAEINRLEKRPRFAGMSRAQIAYEVEQARSNPIINFFSEVGKLISNPRQYFEFNWSLDPSVGGRPTIQGSGASDATIRFPVAGGLGMGQGAEYDLHGDNIPEVVTGRDVRGNLRRRMEEYENQIDRDSR